MYLSACSTRRDETTCQLWGCAERRLVDEDFCCRGHAQLAQARGEWPRPASKGTSVCSLPGCDHLVFRDSETGKVRHTAASLLGWYEDSDYHVYLLVDANEDTGYSVGVEFCAEAVLSHCQGLLGLINVARKRDRREVATRGKRRVGKTLRFPLVDWPLPPQDANHSRCIKCGFIRGKSSRGA